MSTHDSLAGGVMDPQEEAPREVNSLATASWRFWDVPLGIAILCPVLYFQDYLNVLFSWAPDGTRFALTAVLPMALMIMLPRWIAMVRGEVIKMHFPRGRKLAWEVFVSLGTAVVVLIGLLTVSYVYWRITNDSLGNSREYRDIPPGQLMAFLLVSFTLIPIAEEIFFRGFVYNALKKYVGGWANVIQAFLFAIVHPYNMIQTVVIFGLGLVMGKIYQWRKTLVASITVHAFLNFVTAVFTVALLAAYAKMPYIGIEGEIGEQGYAVATVVEESPAMASGIQQGDIITHIDGKNIAGLPTIKSALTDRKIGDTTIFHIQRGDESIELELTLGKRPQG